MVVIKRAAIPDRRFTVGAYSYQIWNHRLSLGDSLFLAMCNGRLTEFHNSFLRARMLHSFFWFRTYAMGSNASGDNAGSGIYSVMLWTNGGYIQLAQN